MPALSPSNDKDGSPDEKRLHRGQHDTPPSEVPGHRFPLSIEISQAPASTEEIPLEVLLRLGDGQRAVHEKPTTLPGQRIRDLLEFLSCPFDLLAKSPSLLPDPLSDVALFASPRVDLPKPGPLRHHAATQPRPTRDHEHADAHQYEPSHAITPPAPPRRPPCILRARRRSYTRPGTRVLLPAGSRTHPCPIL